MTDLQTQYRNTFGTEHGRRVLGDILTLGHVFDTVDPLDPVSVAERNFALVILQMAGGLDLVYAQLGIEVVKQQ